MIRCLELLKNLRIGDNVLCGNFIDRSGLVETLYIQDLTPLDYYLERCEKNGNYIRS